MKLLERGQVTIPKEYRDRYGLRPNTEVEFIPREDGLLLVKKQNISPFDGVYGILSRHESTDELIKEMRGN